MEKAIRIRNNQGYLFEVQHLNDRSRNKVDSWTSHESGFTKAFALRTNYNILRDDFDNELILSYDFEGIRIVDGCRVVDYLVKKSDDILFRSSFFVSNYVDYNWLNVTLSGIDYEMWYSDSCANFYINFSSDLDTIKVENVFVIHLGLFTVFVDNCSGKIVCLGVKDVVYIPDGITNMVDIGLAEVDNKIVPIYEDKDGCVIYGFIDGFKLELLDTSFDDSIAILYIWMRISSHFYLKSVKSIFVIELSIS